MTTATRTTADKLLLDVVEPEISKAFNEEVLGFQMATKSKKDWRGRKVIFDVEHNIGGGVHPTSETGALPEPGAPTHVNGEVYYKRLYGVLEMSHDLIESSRGEKAAFADALQNNLEATFLRMKKKANFDFWGDGRGIMATVSTGGTLKKESAETLQIVVDSTRYLNEGDAIAFWTSSAEDSTVLTDGGQTNLLGTLDSEAVIVNSIDSDTKVTVKRTRLSNADATVAQNNVIRLYRDALADTAIEHENMMGIGGFADDGTLWSTFEGISTTTSPRWKGFSIAASSLSEGTTLSRNHFYKLAHRLRRKGGSKSEVDIFACDPTLMREYLAIADNDVRFTSVNDHDVGYSAEAAAITVGGKKIPIFMDWECPFGVLFGFNKSALEYWEMTPLQLDDGQGGILKQAKPYGASGAGDIYYAFFRMKGNWATKSHWSFGKITGLSYSAENA